MSGLKDLPNVWQSIKEMDLRPIRAEALQEVSLALISRPGKAKEILINQMRHDPQRSNVETFSPVLAIDYEGDDEVIKTALAADLLILLVDETITDISLEEGLTRRWVNSGRKILILLHPPLQEGAQSPVVMQNNWLGWGKNVVLRGSLMDKQFLLRQFAPAVIEALPSKQLALGRMFPLFRSEICHQLINESCFTNAAYAFSTGLAEIVPTLDIPLNVADMMVLSKNQAFLVYRLGLTLGLSTRWQDYVTEFGGILGSGFFWRQVARQLVGLIPAWGIVPKVAVSYAGTYVIGNVVLQWYLTGKKLTRQQINALYIEAFQRGKELASKLALRVPKPRLPKRKPKEYPLPAPAEKVCHQCQRLNAADALFCQYCGNRFDDQDNG
ncbi:MAG: hypothetical protein ACPL4H_06150 [Anaerolineales bacterium]